ncbi:MAG TPA: hypothetical protein VFB42_06655 [Gaiellaceae bacterium]|nr:hypothetical protein [Gaiellaceae bacterium]
MSARITPPCHLPGATEFSDDHELLNPLWVVETVKKTEWLATALEEETNLDKGCGRPKKPGSWALAYLSFVVSGHVDLTPWWAQTTDELWQAAGFEKRPIYKTA